MGISLPHVPFGADRTPGTGSAQALSRPTHSSTRRCPQSGCETRTLLAGAVAAFAPVDQYYLLRARQMQALSFAVHPPWSALGSRFRSWTCLQIAIYTGDPLFRVLAKCWSRAMLALSAVGAVMGTTLSLGLGLLWPGFMAGFGNVFRHLPGGPTPQALLSSLRSPLLPSSWSRRSPTIGTRPYSRPSEPQLMSVNLLESSSRGEHDDHRSHAAQASS